MRPTLRPFVLGALALAACSERAPRPADSAATTPTAAAPAPAAPAEAPLGPGESRLDVDGGRIWYRVSGAGAGTPVILLHGGPGMNSYYLKSLEALGDDRTVVRYDQLGSGKSGPLTDTTKMNVAHFVAELEALRAHLGYDRVHLVGHSWGANLGLEYYRAYPEHVASLTLASPAMDLHAWAANTRRLVKTLPESTQKVIAAAEAAGKFDDPAYQKAMQAFYGRYVFRRPVPADLDSTMQQANPVIGTYMQGPSEFTITGTLRDYDATGFLPQVKVPTLFTVGEFDEADPATVQKHAALVPGAKAVVIPDAAHITSWDNPKAFTDAVRAHLRAADATKR